MKPTIKVTYWGDRAPEIELPAELRGAIDVDLVDGQEAELFYMEHAGVSVYHTHNDQAMGRLSSYHYAVRPNVDIEIDPDGEAFDVRDLPDVPPESYDEYNALFPGSDDRQRIAYAIDQGQIDQEDGYAP